MRLFCRLPLIWRMNAIQSGPCRLDAWCPTHARTSWKDAPLRMAATVTRTFQPNARLKEAAEKRYFERFAESRALPRWFHTGSFTHALVFSLIKRARSGVSRLAINELESMIRLTGLTLNVYAALVTTVYPHSARGPGRCRGRQPQVPAARGIHPPTRRRNLFLFVSRPAFDPEDHQHRPPGDGQDRAGVLPACAQSS